MVWTYFQFTDTEVKICVTRMKNSLHAAFNGSESGPQNSQGRGQGDLQYYSLYIPLSLDIHLDSLIPITRHDEKKVGRAALNSYCC